MMSFDVKHVSAGAWPLSRFLYSMFNSVFQMPFKHIRCLYRLSVYHKVTSQYNYNSTYLLLLEL